MFPKGLPDEGRPTPSMGVPHGWGDKGMKGGWTPRKAGTGWFVQILLEWCQQDDDPETECIYYVQHKEADLLLWGRGESLLGEVSGFDPEGGGGCSC